MNQISEVKLRNKRNILKPLCTKENMSKKRLSLQLGLSSSVLTKLCAELIEEGIIVESDTIASAGVGRKEVLLTINPTYCVLLGITINHKISTIILTDFSMNVLHTVSIPTTMNPEEHLHHLVDLCREIITESTHKNLLGIGISIKGVTDGESSLSGMWNKTVRVREYFAEKLSLNVVMDNGIRCSAMLDQFTNDNNNFIFIKYMEPGIGGSIVKHGQILRGATNTILDFGHMIVNPDGDYCPVCKRKGCLESTISFDRILHHIKSNFSEDAMPMLFEICEGDVERINIQTIITALDGGSIYLNTYFKKVAYYFAICLINTMAICDIKKVVLIGDLFASTRFKEYLRSEILVNQLTSMMDNIEMRVHENEFLSPVALAINEFIFTNYNG